MQWRHRFPTRSRIPEIHIVFRIDTYRSTDHMSMKQGDEDLTVTVIHQRTEEGCWWLVVVGLQPVILTEEFEEGIEFLVILHLLGHRTSRDAILYTV